MSMSKLGERLRERRKVLGKTLREVADATGLSVGFLSQIERNLTIPSLVSLAEVAQALDISVSELVVSTVPPRMDTHADQRKAYQIEPEGAMRYERLSSAFRGSMLHSVKFSMPCGHKSEIVSHAGEEMIYVLCGRILYIVADKRYVLEAGDSIHFDAKIPHGLECLQHELGYADVIWTGTLDIFGSADLDPVHGEPIDMKGTEFHELTLLN
jgi:transcriptional regulator with XRE-family HTH domain